MFLNNRISTFLRQRVVYHSLLWSVYLSISIWLNLATPSAWEQPLLTVLINFCFVAIAVYSNFYILIPTYLQQKQYLRYLLFSVLLCLLLMPIKTTVLYLRASGQPTLQEQILANQWLYFAYLLFWYTVATILKIIVEWQRGQLERERLRTESLQSELQFLKTQINPHFLFNTLNSIYALTLKQSDDAPETVLRLSEMMRYMLYDCNEKLVPLDKELAYIENYIELETLRHGRKASVSFELRDDVRGYYIVPVLLITFVENAFKHGVSQQLSDSFVKISLSIEGQKLHFEVINSKAAAAPPALSGRQGGIGLLNTKRRLELLYGTEYYLNLSDDGATYSATLHIPLSTHSEFVSNKKN